MNKMMLRDILKLVIVLFLFHFVGNIVIYNVLIQSLGQTVGGLVHLQLINCRYFRNLWRYRRNN